MDRKERRAAAHLQRKLDRKSGFPTTPAPVIPEINIPEPGLPLPSLDSVTPPAKLPISEARREANRQNAQHSTGPTTPAGVAASSQNRTVHGLARHNGAFKILPTEDPIGFEALKANLVEEHEPSTETESILVTTMAESHWLAARAQNLQAACCDANNGQITDPKMFTLYLRYQTTHTRAFHNCLNDLLKLRSERRKEDLGFEAQARKEEELRIKNEQHEMKKQSLYWEVLFKDAKACHQMTMNLRQQSLARSEDPGFQAEYEAELAKRGAKPSTWACAEADA